MRLKKRLLFVLFLISSHQLFAHAVWIETNATGIKGQAQEVRIYFGEFSEKDISPAGKWFSDLKDFSLVLLSPDGTRSVLSAAPATDCYKTAFTPAQDGIYTLVLHHLVKDVYHNMKLDYNSSATVRVGNRPDGNDAFVNTNSISLFSADAATAETNKDITVKSVHEAKPAAGQEIKVIAPNGWSRELYSNEKGEISFQPPWPGTYMVEFPYTDKTAGEHNETKYEETWKMATYIIAVK